MPAAMSNGSRRSSLSISALLNEVSIEPLQHPLSSHSTELPAIRPSTPASSSPPSFVPISSASSSPHYAGTTTALPSTSIPSLNSSDMTNPSPTRKLHSSGAPILPAIYYPHPAAAPPSPNAATTNTGSYFYHSPLSSGSSSPTNSSFESLSHVNHGNRPSATLPIPSPAPYLTPAMTEPPDLWSHPTTGMHKSNTGNIIVSSLAKAKRKRILPHQYKRLLETFEVTDTPSSEIRSQLAAELDMTKREVQVWFQNRRAKMNRCRQQGQMANGKSSVHITSTTTSTPYSSKTPSTTFRHNSLTLGRKNSFITTSPPLPPKRSFSFEHQRLLEAPFQPKQEDHDYFTDHRDSVCSSLSGSSTPNGSVFTNGSSCQNIDILATAAAEVLKR